MNLSQVSEHNSLETGIWIVCNGIVYDITKFIARDLHPGSSAIITPYFGKDMTTAFKIASHSRAAEQLLKKYKIGKIASLKKWKPLPWRAWRNRLAINIQNLFSTSANNICVTKIFIYPVKGCQGIQVNSVHVSQDGLLNDRIYAICNKRTGNVVNQLTYPILSQVHTDF
eukprot:455593_1